MIITDSSIVGPWVCERTGGVFEEKTSTAIGWIRGDELVSGVVYDMHNGRSICMHVATLGPMTRGFIRTAFDYPFNQLGLSKVIGLVDSTNEKALKLDKHLGFVQEACIKDAAKDGDLLILTMTRQQCRWI